MGKYIDVDNIKYISYVNGDVTVSKEEIERIPAANVREIKQGSWIFGKWVQGHWVENESPNRVRCSICHRDFPIDNSNCWWYCPQCGNKMTIN